MLNELKLSQNNTRKIHFFSANTKNNTVHEKIIKKIPYGSEKNYFDFINHPYFLLFVSSLILDPKFGPEEIMMLEDNYDRAYSTFVVKNIINSFSIQIKFSLKISKLPKSFKVSLSSGLP